MMDEVEPGSRPGNVLLSMAMGALIGLSLLGIFFLAYLVAPGLSLGTTCVLAALAAIVIALALIVSGPPLVTAQRAPLSMHDERHDRSAIPTPMADPAPDQVLIEEMEAKAARLREELNRLDRGKQNAEWLEVNLARGEVVQQLALKQISMPSRSSQKMALGQFRVAAHCFRSVADRKGKQAPGPQAAKARIGAAECMLALGELENSREHLEEAARDFAIALGLTLDGPDRERAKRGSASAEVLLSERVRSNEADASVRDDFF